MLRKLFLVIGLLSFGVAVAEPVIKLATTTSTQNSGLLERLLPTFEKVSGYDVHVIAVGTGKALRMGADGDVDVVLVHAPAAEDAFINAGHGVKRYPVMYNDFVLVGPKHAPGEIAHADSITSALSAIGEKGLRFVSRGDDSGTHKKEKSLWQAGGIEPYGTWYVSAGQGMGKVLQIANEMQAYTLADRGTWLAYKDKVDLQIVREGDAHLRNPYSIIAVNPLRYPDLNNQGARALIDWMISREGQMRIGAYRLHNQQLFHPSATSVAGQ